MELQERKLFEYFIVVALHKTKAGVPYLPEVTQQFPLKVQEEETANKSILRCIRNSRVLSFVTQLERSFKFMREAEDQLKVIPQFCFPDAKDWAPVDNFPRSVGASGLPWRMKPNRITGISPESSNKSTHAKKPKCKSLRVAVKMFNSQPFTSLDNYRDGGISTLQLL